MPLDSVLIGPRSIPSGGVGVGLDHVPVGVGVWLGDATGVAVSTEAFPWTGLISVGLGSANVGNCKYGNGCWPQGVNTVPHCGGGTIVLSPPSVELDIVGVGVVVGVLVGPWANAKPGTANSVTVTSTARYFIRRLPQLPF